MSPAVRRALALAVIWTLVASAEAFVLSKSELKTCVQDGSTANVTTTCSNKLILQVVVKSNKIAHETDGINFNVTCVDSPTGQCPCPCNYVTDDKCKCRDINKRVLIEITKTAVVVKYPLTYRRTFHGAVWEGFRKTTSCEDDPWADDVTCGWARDPVTNAKILHSQGFCCKCDFFNLFSDNWLFRSNEKCDKLSLERMAHCYRFDANKEHLGFEIGMQHKLAFSIVVTISTFEPNGARIKRKSLTVRPTTPIAKDTVTGVGVELLGDFANYVVPPQVHGKWMMIPIKPVDASGASKTLVEDAWAWMIVDRSMVSTTGLECDKIGVDYNGFLNSQANRCNVPAGSCLKNQIEPLRNQDLFRVQQGLDPEYLIGRYGSSTPPAWAVDGACKGCTGFNPPDDLTKPIGWDVSTGLPKGYDNRWLQFPVKEVANSVLSMTLEGNDLSYTVTRSPAKITRVEVCSKDGRKCGSFEAMTTSGYLNVDVLNAGFIPADYTVTVSSCGDHVLDVMPQHSSIFAKSTEKFQFELQMTSMAAANISCEVQVWDSQKEVATAQTVTFKTTEVIIELPPVQPGDIGGAKGVAVDPDAPRPNLPEDKAAPEYCERACPNIMNLKCLMDNGCYGRMAKGIAAIGAPVAVVGALLAAWKTGHLSIAIRVLVTLFSFIFCRARTQPAPEPAKKGVDGSGKKEGKMGRESSQGDEEGGGSSGKQGNLAKASVDGSVQMTMKTAGKGVPASGSEPPGGGLLRQRSGAMTRSHAIMSAAYQAKVNLIGMNQVLISNPLAARPETHAGTGPVHGAQPTLSASTLPPGAVGNGQSSSAMQQQMLMMQQQLARIRQQRMQMEGAQK